jgi:hypothetical protein
VLSVGPVSIWLPPNAARDVVATLGRALLVETLGVRQPTPAAAPPPRVASN